MNTENEVVTTNPAAAIAAEVDRLARELVAKQRALADLLAKQFQSEGRNSDPLSVVASSEDLASRLENAGYQFRTQTRIVRKLGEAPASSSEPSHG